MNRKNCYLFNCSIFLFTLLQFCNVNAKETIPSTFARQSLSFIENNGQITNLSGQLMRDIRYKLSARDVNIFIGKDGLHYQFYKNESCPDQVKNSIATPLSHKPLKTTIFRTDVILEGANQDATIEAAEELPYYEQYVQSGNTITSHTYNRIIYKDIYPFIDWVLYIKDDKLEYDFVVRPGGKVSDIKLQYKGADYLALTVSGNLNVKTPAGEIEEQKPVAYEMYGNHPVSSKFILSGNVLGFETGAYSGTLIVDPQLYWGTYYGGTGNDQGFAVAADSKGSVYMVGTTTSTANIATAGSYKSIYDGSTNGYVVKFDAAGNRLWATYYGGKGGYGYTDVQGAICDRWDNLYITGVTGSATNIATSGSFKNTLTGYDNAFLAKFDASGNIKWGTYYGGDGTYGNGVAVDTFGNIFLAGKTSDRTAIATPGSYKDTLLYGPNAFLAKFDSSGSRLWATYYGAEREAVAYGVGCDPAGNVFITGQVNSADGVATPGAYQTAYSGGSDAYLAKFNGNGNMQWSTYYGGSGFDNAYSIAADGFGNVFITGLTNSSGLATPGAFSTAGSVFLAKFNGIGALKWSTYFGASGDQSYAATCDKAGNVYIGGMTASGSGIATAGSYQNILYSCCGYMSAYWEAFNTSGKRLYGTYYGSNNNIRGICTDAMNNLFASGYIPSAGSNIASAGGYQSIFGGGGNDAFMGKFAWETKVYVNEELTDTAFCMAAGGNFNVFYSAMGKFHPDNIFTVQLSDSAGSFAHAVNIGSTMDSISGHILCNIPSTTPASSKYTIRIIASSPADTSIADSRVIHFVTTTGSVTLSSNSPVCGGDTLRLFASGTIVNGYSWSGPGGFTSVLQNPYIVHADSSDAGWYHVSARVDGCLSAVDSININVTIEPQPVIGYNDSLCKGDSLMLHVSNATPGSVYTWKGPGAFTSSSADTTLINPLAGVYSVSATMGGCTTRDSVFVHVNNFTPVIPLDSSNSAICAGDTLRLFITDTTSFSSYSWTGPNGFTSSVRNPVIPSAGVSASGTYHVIVTYSYCSYTDSLHYSVTTSVTPHIAISNLSGDPICAGSVINFNSTISHGGPTPGYQWVSSSAAVPGATGNTWSTAHLSNGDTVYCVLTSSEACATNVTDTSNKIIVTILPLLTPLVAITVSPGTKIWPGDTATFTPTVTNRGNLVTYQWMRNNTPIAGASDSFYTTKLISEGDQISLNIHTTPTCPATDSAVSNIIIMHIIEGVPVLNGNANIITLYPDPNPGIFTVNGTFNNVLLKKADIKIYNAAGRMVYSNVADIVNGKLDTRIQLEAHLPGGVYLLQVSTGGYKSNLLHFVVEK